MEIHHYESEEETWSAAVDRLNVLVGASLDAGVLLLFSGGSALSLVDGLDRSLLDRRVTLAVLDERFTEEEQGNNFAKLMSRPLFTVVKEQGVRTIGTIVHEGELLDGFADRFDAALHKWRTEHPEGVIIATMGIGNDGHTSGVLPYPDAPDEFAVLFEGESWVVGYDATVERNAWPLRATTTLTFLREQVHEAIVYVVGQGKQEAFSRVTAKESERESLCELPAAIIQEMPSVHLYTDLSI